jgi:hypothetical protein
MVRWKWKSAVLYHVIQGLRIIKDQPGNDVHRHQLFKQSVLNLNMKCTGVDEPLGIIILQRTEW